MDVVGAVRGAVRGVESRRRVPYGMRSGEQPSAWVETEETRATSRRLLVAIEEGNDRGRTARYFRNLGWTVDVGQTRDGSEDGTRHHDLAIVSIRAERDDVGTAFDRLQDIRGRDPEAIVIVVGDLSAAQEAEARARGAQAVVHARPYLPDLAHLAFSLTGVFRG